MAILSRFIGSTSLDTIATIRVRSSMWYAYGGVVLDRIFRTRWSREITLYFEESPPSTDLVRARLALSRVQTLIISSEVPKRVCNLDWIQMREDSALYLHDRPLENPPRELLLTEYDLDAEDLIRFDRWIRVFPELHVSEPLANRIRSSTEHLAHLS